MVKNFNNADKIRTPDKTKGEVVELGSVTGMKITLKPGWKWPEWIIQMSEQNPVKKGMWAC